MQGRRHVASVCRAFLEADSRRLMKAFGMNQSETLQSPRLGELYSGRSRHVGSSPRSRAAQEAVRDAFRTNATVREAICLFVAVDYEYVNRLLPRASRYVPPPECGSGSFSFTVHPTLYNFTVHPRASVSVSSGP